MKLIRIIIGIGLILWNLWLMVELIKNGTIVGILRTGFLTILPAILFCKNIIKQSI